MLHQKKKFTTQNDYTTEQTKLTANVRSKLKGSARKKPNHAITVNVSQHIKFSVKSGGMDVSESQDNKDFRINDNEFDELPNHANYEACLKTGNFGGNLNFDESKSVDDVLDNDTTT